MLRVRQCEARLSHHAVPEHRTVHVILAALAVPVAHIVLLVVRLHTPRFHGAGGHRDRRLHCRVCLNGVKLSEIRYIEDETVRGVMS